MMNGCGDGSSGAAVDSNIIVSLLKLPFDHRTIVERDAIVRAGRPTPPVKTLKEDMRSDGQKYLRSFKLSWYSTHKWLAGCRVSNKLYCWPCLLMCKKKGPWTLGFFDLKNLSGSSFKHLKSKEHLQSQLALKRWERALTKKNTVLLSDHARARTAEFNENVQKNRELVKKMIELISLFSKQEHFVGGIDEGNGFKESFLYYIRDNTMLVEHYRALGQTIAGLEGTIQQEILECLEEEVSDFIRGEINTASFFSIQVDDVTDISNKSQCSIIVRFVDVNGDIQERFLGCFRLIGDLCPVLMSALEDFSVADKLVSQCYDGGIVIVNSLHSLQDVVKSVAPQAFFVHFTASHKLDALLQQGASCSLQETREFFATVVEGLPALLGLSPKRCETVTRVLADRIPSHIELSWSSYSKLFAFVLDQRENLYLVFDELIHAADSPVEIRTRACALKATLSDFNNLFMLMVYHDIFTKTDILFDALHMRISEVDYCVNEVEQTIQYFKQFRTEEQAHTYLCEAEAKFGREVLIDQKDEIYGKIGSKYTDLFFEIIDNVTLHLETRFCNLKKLKFLELVDNSKFRTYEFAFPQSAFQSLKNSYGPRFEFDRLRSELEILYADQDFYDRSVPFTIKLIIISDLKEIFQQVYQLYSLVASLPLTAAPQERSFPCLERVKAYLRGAMKRDGPSSVSTIFIEKKVVTKLESRSSWYDDLINRLALKKIAIDLQCKV